MQNAKTCIFNYNKDLQIKVFYTFTVVQNIFFSLGNSTLLLGKWSESDLDKQQLVLPKKMKFLTAEVILSGTVEN